MTCSRAFEIDLPAFLRDPRAAEWDDFRAHYPRCADCAAEVAAWTSVEGLLGAGSTTHPDAEDLLRWTDAPESLAPERRLAVARHVDACATCRDELRALEGFALPASDAPAARPRARAAGSAHGEPGARAGASGEPGVSGATAATRPEGAVRVAAATRPGTVEHGGRPRGRRGTAERPHRDAGRRGGWRAAGRVLWHPAVAYALLLAAVLAPTFRARFTELGGPPVTLPGAAPGRDAPIAAAGSERAAGDRKAVRTEPAQEGRAADALVRGRPGEVTARLEPAARGAAPRPAPPPRRQPVPPAAEQERAQAPVPAAPPEAPVPAAPPEAPVPAAPAPAAPGPASDAADRRAERAAAVADRAAYRSLADAAEEDGEGRTAPQLSPPDARGSRRLTLPVPPEAANASVLEVWIRDAAGDRELRERISLRGDVREVALALPAAWLDAPTWVVEVRAHGRSVARYTIASR